MDLSVSPEEFVHGKKTRKRMSGTKEAQSMGQLDGPTRDNLTRPLDGFLSIHVLIKEKERSQFSLLGSYDDRKKS